MYEDNISAQYCIKSNADCKNCDNYRFFFKDHPNRLKCKMQESLRIEKKNRPLNLFLDELKKLKTAVAKRSTQQQFIFRY